MYLVSSDFRTSGVQYWRSRCLKSGPKLTCFVHFYFKMYVSPQRRAFFQHLNFKKCSRTLSFLTFSLPNVFFTTAACIFSTSELQKVLPDPQFFSIFTSKCVFHHSGVHFFNILNFKKCSRTLSFLTFSLQNVRFATAACIFSTSELQKVLPDPQFFNIFTSKCVFTTAACIFSTSELQKVLPDPQFFNIFTSKCVFHHSGVHFFNI